jgi:signal transduction histidine kinase
VAAAVALVTSLVNVASLARLAVAEASSRAGLLAETFYHQSSRVIRQVGGRRNHADENIRQALSKDTLLASYAEGVVGYSATVMYVALTDRDGVSLVHSNPQALGKVLEPATSLESFAEESPFAQLWALSQGHRILGVTLPFEVDGEPYGAVHVAISTLLLKEEIEGALVRNVLFATAAVVVTFVGSLFVANWLLAPLEMLRRELVRFDPGEGEPPLDLRNEADVSRVAEFFASMSQRLSEGKAGKEGSPGWLSTMLGGLADAVVVVSEEGSVLSMNEPAEKLMALGRKSTECEGESLFDLLAPDHPVAQIVSEALEKKANVGPINERLSGNALHMLSAQVLRDASGITGVMVSARNMDKLSRLGSHLSYSQKLAALGKLTSGVAHEIKNPLNAMVIHVALLREKLAKAAPEAKGSLDTLEREIRRLDRVIQGFLRFTRPEHLQLASVSLPELLEEVVRLVSAEAEASHIRVRMQLGDDLPDVYGDRELLQQVFVNLVRNACEAMPNGGKLDLEANLADEGGLLITVSDTGMGIPKDMLETIFDLYVTTKSQGSGIGLSMVYRIVQLHGGEITVESEEGEGARFAVYLPEAPA